MTSRINFNIAYVIFWRYLISRSILFIFKTIIQHKFFYKIFSDVHKRLLGTHTVHAGVVTSFRLLTLPTRKTASGLAVQRHSNGGNCRSSTHVTQVAMADPREGGSTNLNEPSLLPPSFFSYSTWAVFN